MVKPIKENAVKTSLGGGGVIKFSECQVKRLPVGVFTKGNGRDLNGNWTETRSLLANRQQRVERDVSE
jgi:hypothetical protein